MPLHLELRVIYSKIRYSILNEDELFLVKNHQSRKYVNAPLILQNEPIGFLDLYNVANYN